MVGALDGWRRTLVYTPTFSFVVEELYRSEDSVWNKYASNFYNSNFSANVKQKISLLLEVRMSVRLVIRALFGDRIRLLFSEINEKLAHFAGTLTFMSYFRCSIMAHPAANGHQVPMLVR